MHQQIVKNQPLKTWQGLLVVVGIIAAILLDSLITGLITPLVGGAIAAVFFWGAGILVALWTMRRFVLSYSYVLSGTALKITHIYGRYQRPMEDVYLNTLLACGTPEEMRKRFSGARVSRAVRPKCDLEHFAIAYTSGGNTRILILQPDETIREALTQRARKKGK